MRKSLKDIELPLIEHPRSRNSLHAGDTHEANHTPCDRSHLNEYDPDKIPPDFNLAQMHGKASRVYKQIEAGKHAEEGSAADCPCCGLPVNGEELPLNCDLESFYYLGCGYALYFRFLKYAIALLGILFLISGSYNLLTNISQDDCTEDDAQQNFCSGDRVSILSIANKRDDVQLLTYQVVVNFITVVVIILFFHYIRYQSRKIAIEADDKTVTPSDYTVHVTGLPSDATDNEIKEWVEGFATPEQPIKCRKITRAYKIIEFVEYEAQKDKLLKQLKQEMDYNNKLIIEQEIGDIENKISSIKTSLAQEYTPEAFVTLTHAQMAAYITQKFKKRSWLGKMFHKVNPFAEKFKMRDHKIKVKRAPEPDDIIWTNLSYTKDEKRKSRYVTFACTLLVLILSFLAILGVYYAQEFANENYGESINKIMKVFSFSASMIICTINTILAMVIRWLTEYEKNSTKTRYSSSIAKKQSVALVINTAFTSLLAEIVISGGVQTVDEVISGVESLNIYGHGGLIGNMFFVFITNALYTPILTYFDVFYYLKIFYQKKALNEGENAIMTQAEANTLFEGPQPAMSNKYAAIIKAMLLTAFYAPAMPITILFTIGGLVLNYWVDKYLLLRRNGLPPALNHDLNNDMIEYLEWMTFTFAVGNLMFLFTLIDTDGNKAYNDSSAVLIWLTIIISLVHIMVPMDRINKRLFKIQDDITETLSFDEARSTFTTDYDIQNPMTRDHALRELLSSMHHHHRNNSKIVKMLQENNGMLFNEMIQKAMFNIEENGKNEQNQDINCVNHAFKRNKTGKYMF